MEEVKKLKVANNNLEQRNEELVKEVEQVFISQECVYHLPHSCLLTYHYVTACTSNQQLSQRKELNMPSYHYVTVCRSVVMIIIVLLSNVA